MIFVALQLGCEITVRSHMYSGIFIAGGAQSPVTFQGAVTSQELTLTPPITARSLRLRCRPESAAKSGSHRDQTVIFPSLQH